MLAFRVLAFSAGLLVVADAVRGQTFSATAAFGIETDEQFLVDAGAENVNAEEVSGDVGPGPVPNLERQDLVAVGPFIRTCPCTRVRNLVRLRYSSKRSRSLYM